MPERDVRRRIPAHRRPHSNTRAPEPSSSPPAAPRRRFRPSTPRKCSDRKKVLKRSRSEPSLWKSRFEEVSVEEVEVEVLFRPRTCTDLFVSPDYIDPRSLLWCSKEYKKEAKVVVNVTVEGSPGPIRTLVKLGANVEETIDLVVKKYNEEGRTPRLDRDAASTCELHSSYFSLESLCRSDLIGDVGSRSFYLRKGSDVDTSSNSEISSVRMLQKLKRFIGNFCKLFGCLPLY